MKIEITDAAVEAVATARMTPRAAINDYGYRDNIRLDLAAALPHLKVTEERKYRVNPVSRLIEGYVVITVQRDSGGWTDVGYCTSPDDAQAIMDALIAAERGAA